MINDCLRTKSCLHIYVQICWLTLSLIFSERAFNETVHQVFIYVFSFGEVLMTEHKTTIYFFKVILVYWWATSIHQLLIIPSECYKLPPRFTDLKPCAILFAVTITVLEYRIENQIAVFSNCWGVKSAQSFKLVDNALRSFLWMLKVRKHCL